MKIAYIFGSTPLRHADEPDLVKAVTQKGDWVGLQAREISALGHDVSIFILHKKKSLFLEHDGVKWNICKADITHRKLIAGKEPSVEMYRKVFSSKPDIIHFNSIHFCMNYAFYTYRAGCHKIPIMGQHHGGRFPGHFWDRWALGYALKNSDHAVFPTKEELQFYKKWYNLSPDKVSILHAGYAENFTVMDKTEARNITGMSGDPIILWVAQLQRRKDPLTVLKAFESVVQKYPGARLYIIGSGEMGEELTTYVNSKKQLKETVSLMGYILHENLKPFFNSADIYVLASHVEALGCSLLEAMACGIATVSTSIPAFCNITENGKHGLLFEPGNHVMLEKKLIELIQNKELRLIHANRAAHRVKSGYGWPAVSRKTILLYEKILKNYNDK